MWCEIDERGGVVVLCALAWEIENDDDHGNEYFLERLTAI